MSNYQQRERIARRENEALLIQDHEKAISMIVERLQQQVQRSGRTIFIEEGKPPHTLHAFSLRVNWHIECGRFGMRVIFTGATTDENSLDGVEVQLITAKASVGQCRVLVPPVAEILAGFGGR